VNPQLKFNTVLKTLDGQAKRMAAAISSTGGNPFEKLLRAFQKEFADRDQIIMKQRELVCQQKSWPKKYAEQRDWLITMDGVQASFRVFKLDIDQESSLYFGLLAKLDDETRVQWAKRSQKRGLQACWSSLMGFLEENSVLARRCELDASAAASVGSAVKKTTTGAAGQKVRGKTRETTAFQFVTGEAEPATEESSNEEESSSIQLAAGAVVRNGKSSDKGENKRRGFLEKCPGCKGPYHNLAECEGFAKLQPTKRMELVTTYRFCTCCLKKHAGGCKAAKPCPEENCKYKHHRLLHGGDFAEAIAATSINRKKIVEAELAGLPMPMLFTAGCVLGGSFGTTDRLARANATSADAVGRPFAETQNMAEVITEGREVPVKNAVFQPVVCTSNQLVRASATSAGVEVRPDVRLLRVAKVIVRRADRPWRTEKFSVLIDSGANMTVVDESIGHRLKLPMVFKMQNSFSFHGVARNRSALVSLEVSADGENWWALDRVITTPKLELPATELKWTEWLSDYEEFREVLPYIEDQDYGDVKMILGLDKEFVNGERFIYPEDGSMICSQDGHYQVHKCALGWLATGKMKLDSGVLLSIFLSGGSCGRTVEDFQAEEELIEATNELTQQFCRFQTLEDLGVKPVTGVFSPQEELELERMQQTVVVKDGRVAVPMLWKLPKRKMPPSEVQARRRLALLWKRLEREDVLREHYVASVKKDEDKGYVRRLTPEEVEAWKNEMWILPHFPVYHPDKPHKVRRVCDAAAKNFGVSLNSELEQGPNNISSLLGVLLRFRQGKFAVQGDVGEMFNRIGVAEEDQKRLVFLWQEGPFHPIEYYCYTCHIFGARCAPAVANFVVGYLLEKEGVSDSEGKRRRFYMDDFFAEGDDPVEVANEVKEVTQALKKNGMVLGKWVINHPEIQDKMKKEALLEDGAAELSSSTTSPAMGEFEFQDKEQSCPSKNKILGVQWNVQEDCLTFSTRASGKGPKTAAEVLSVLASIFDPLGIVAPVVFRGKLLMRRVWQDKQAWHVSVDEELLKEWASWMEEVERISELRIPRWYGTKKTTRVQLHVFGDASDKGYGCVSYILFLEDGVWKTAYVNSKSRLNAESGHNSAISEAEPIARVELQACLLGFRQAAVLLGEMDLQIVKVVLWTDSQVVYWWTRNNRARYPPFVRSRLKEIYEMRYKFGKLSTVSTQVLYVPTKENPADLVSRGPSGEEFVQQFEFWTSGPKFLREGPEAWPEQPDRQQNPLLKEEEPKIVLVAGTAHQAESSCTWLGYLHVRCDSLDATAEELKKAEIAVLREVQEEEFAREVSHLKEKVAKGESWMPKFSNRLKGRRLFLDEDGVMRLESRAELIDDELWSYDQKYPVVMPNRHPVSDLICRSAHVEVKHTGGETTWGRVNKKFYIPGGRKRCIQLVRECKLCNRVEPKTSRPPTASLHRSRLNVRKPAWTDTGIDFFGPLMCVSSGHAVKRYGLILIDMTSRALHLELTQSLELDSLMLAFERFRCVRGTAKTFRCDNGTTFHGADNEFRRLEQDVLIKLARAGKVKWGSKFEFNPPYAPHWGGSWERLIKEVKRCMLKAFEQPDRRAKTDEILRTILYEAMWVLNNRPLCIIEDGRVLTPAMLINPASDDGCGYPLECTRLQQVRLMEKCVTNFWNVFSSGYLGLLKTTARQGTDGATRKFTIGQAVVVREPRADIGQWTAGRIVKAVESSDGRLRSALVKTKDGEVWRDIGFIAPCEDEALGRV
jgi:hypothetical protein